jgi:hypothetical protein
VATPPVGLVVDEDAELVDARRQGLGRVRARLDLADQAAVHLDAEVEVAPQQPP